MRVTVMADASFCPETCVAGYGYWVASNRGKQKGSGIIRAPCSTSIVAEMMAVVNAVHGGLKHRLIDVHDELLIQTDCQAAIQAFENRRNHLSDEEYKVIKYLKKLKVQFGLTIRLKHVKGHSNNPEARFVANNHCDQLARDKMSKARQQFRKREDNGT